MSIWKNTEVRRTALWLLLATAVCSVAAALLYPACGLLTLGLGAICGAIWYQLHPAALQELERMSQDIDRVPPRAGAASAAGKGELAILREIRKMTVRLRENAQRQRGACPTGGCHGGYLPPTADAPDGHALAPVLLEQEELTPQRRLALMPGLKKLTGRMGGWWRPC